MLGGRNSVDMTRWQAAKAFAADTWPLLVLIGLILALCVAGAVVLWKAG